MMMEAFLILKIGLMSFKNKLIKKGFYFFLVNVIAILYIYYNNIYFKNVILFFYCFIFKLFCYCF